jgi:hypothetical protein
LKLLVTDYQKKFAVIFFILYFKDICWLRLDFETFQTLGPTSTDEPNGGACPDTFVAKVSYCIIIHDSSDPTKVASEAETSYFETYSANFDERVD